MKRSNQPIKFQTSSLLGNILIPAIFVFSFLVTGNSFSQSSPPATVTFYLENDVFSNTDEYYTHGCGLSWVSRDFTVVEPPLFFTQPLFKLLSLVGKKGTSRNVSISFRQNIYTPRNISTEKFIQDDQPYAGITYFPVGVHEKNAFQITSLELDIGIVGPHSYAARSQKQIHALIDSPDPKGWNNQLKDEVIVNLGYDYRWLLLKKNFFKKFGVDVLPYLGGAVGNMRTLANVAAQLRVGWSIPNDFGPYIIQPSCECQIPSEGLESSSSNAYSLFSIYFYTIFHGQAVLHDIFLDGNTFKNSPHVDKNILQGIITFGIGIRIHRFKIDYSNVRQTRTFKTQPTPHRYGRLTMTVFI